MNKIFLVVAVASMLLLPGCMRLGERADVDINKLVDKVIVSGVNDSTFTVTAALIVTESSGTTNIGSGNTAALIVTDSSGTTNIGSNNEFGNVIIGSNTFSNNNMDNTFNISGEAAAEFMKFIKENPVLTIILLLIFLVYFYIVAIKKEAK